MKIRKQFFSLITASVARNKLRSLYFTKSFNNNNISNNITQVFNEQQWEEYYTDIINSQKDKPKLNAGQITLLGEEYFIPPALDYCSGVGMDYDPSEFVSYVQGELGEDYYNAISETINDASLELYEVFDVAWGNNNSLFSQSIGKGKKNKQLNSSPISHTFYSRTARGYVTTTHIAGQSLTLRYLSGPNAGSITTRTPGSVNYQGKVLGRPVNNTFRSRIKV